MKYFKKNQNGMSLIGVIVAASIGLVVTMGLTDLISNVFKSQRSVQSKDANRDLAVGIRSLLTDPVACANSMAGIGPLSATGVLNIAQLKDKNGTVIYQTNTSYLNSLVKITAFEIKNYDAVKGMAELDLKMDKVGSTIGGTQMVNKIYMKVTVDASTKIAKCNALGSADSLWQLSSNLTDIYYTGGNVGIGTTNPTNKLEVSQGNIATNFNDGWAMHSGITFSNMNKHNSVFMGLRSRGTQTAPTYPLSGDSIASFVGRDAIDGLTSTSGNYGGAQIYFRASENFSPTAKGTDMYFDTTANGTANTRTNMILTNTGNVGIGTTTPLFPLHVVNTIYVSNAAKNSGIYVDASIGNFGSIQAVNSANTVAQNLALQQFGGNVGIGTTAPATKLDVAGGIRPQAATLGGPCTPIGTQAYNSANGSPLYCNGTPGVWTAVGGGGFGGSYAEGQFCTGCVVTNPITGGCTCPTGTNPHYAGGVYHNSGACYANFNLCY